MIIRNRYRLKSLIIDGASLRISTNLACRRGPGLVRIAGHTVTPTGADYGTDFTFTVSPPAEKHELLNAILEQNAIAQNSLRNFVIQNKTTSSGSLPVTTALTMTDVLNFTEIMSAVHLSGNMISVDYGDSLTFNDNLVQSHVAVRAVNDTLTFNEALSSIHSMPNSMSDTLTFTDAMTVVHYENPSFGDTLNFTETLSIVIIQPPITIGFENLASLTSPVITIA